MFNRISKLLFSIVFLAMIILPLVSTNMVNQKVSESENRRLAPQPVIYNGDGTRNEKFIADFESWLNDNIGFRDLMVVNNARMQYYGFNVLANNSNMYLGPHGELNYATDAMIKDYQHNNIYKDEYLKRFAESMQVISDYVEERGARLYYFQCWDKHSIYPEYFPKSVIQHGLYSKTDGMVKALDLYSDVNVISPKEILIDSKEEYNTYSVWGDPTHWTQRGAYIGYLTLMEEINKNDSKPFKVLSEDDYVITTVDCGNTVFGGIHREDKEEKFEIKEPAAELKNDLLTFGADDQRHSYRVNKSADNETRVLIIGDSYFNSFIIDDISESFAETVMIWGDYLDNLEEILDAYPADIVIIEAAERVDRSGRIIKEAEAILQADR